MSNSINFQHFNKTIGCIASLSDSKHDFGKFKNIDKIIDDSKDSIPCKDDESISPLTEEGFLLRYIWNTDISPNKKDITETSFKENIQDDYKIFIDNYDINSSSNIQKNIQEAGITDKSIFIICDTSYSSLKKDLKNVNNVNNGEQKFYWCQTKQTLYDPAGKTNYNTGKNYGFQNNNSNFLFCWENGEKENIDYYPSWKPQEAQTLDELDTQDDNIKLCTNKEIWLKLNYKNVNDYKNYESYLLIYDPITKKYSYANKKICSI